MSLFKKMIGMKDFCVGCGFYLMYYVKYWFMWFLLDYLFYIKEFMVGKMEWIFYFGSDYFGMYYEIYLKNMFYKFKNLILKFDEK